MKIKISEEKNYSITYGDGKTKMPKSWYTKYCVFMLYSLIPSQDMRSHRPTCLSTTLKHRVEVEHGSINDTYCQRVCCKRWRGCGGSLNVNIQPETVSGFSYRKHKSNSACPQHKSGPHKYPLQPNILISVSITHTTPCRWPIQYLN